MKQLVYFAAEMYNWTALFPVDTLTAVIPFHVFFFAANITLSPVFYHIQYYH